MLTLAIEMVICDCEYPGVVVARENRTQRHASWPEAAGGEGAIPCRMVTMEDRAQLFLSQVVSINTTCQRAYTPYTSLAAHPSPCDRFRIVNSCSIAQHSEIPHLTTRRDLILPAFYTLASRMDKLL